jgi:hypothetical protein
MIYRLNNVVLVPGKMANNLGVYEKEFLPASAQCGLNLVGAFHSYTGNMNEIFFLHQYKGLAEFQEIQNRVRASKECQAALAKLSTTVVRSNVVLLDPNPWSPMK